MKDERKYEIWMRNYPQPDVNISEEWNLYPMSLIATNAFIADLEDIYSNEGWKGHRLYKAKFYAEEVR